MAQDDPHCPLQSQQTQEAAHAREGEELVAHKSAEPWLEPHSVDTQITPEDKKGHKLPLISQIDHKWRFRDGKFKNQRDQWLYYVSYFPTATNSQPLRGVVLFLHGIGEYARRFTHVFDVLCAHGFGVIAYDLISHGRSDDDDEGERAHALDFQHFVDDTNVFVSFAKQSILPAMCPAGTQELLPLVFMGMSYGTLVGLHTVLSEKHAFQGVVLAAPALAVEWTPLLKFQRYFMAPVANLLPRIRVVPGVNYEYLSRCPSFLDDFMADPLITTAKLTVRMASETLNAMEKVRHDPRIVDPHSAFCHLPLLIVQGSSDKITSVALAEEFYQRVGAQDKHFEKFDGLYHCIFNEPERDIVTDHISQWLVKRFPPKSA